MLGEGSPLVRHADGGPVLGVDDASSVNGTPPVGQTKAKHLCHDTSLMRMLWYCASATIAKRVGNAHESPETPLTPQSFGPGTASSHLYALRDGGRMGGSSGSHYPRTTCASQALWVRRLDSWDGRRR